MSGETAEFNTAKDTPEIEVCHVTDAKVKDNLIILNTNEEQEYADQQQQPDFCEKLSEILYDNMATSEDVEEDESKSSILKEPEVDNNQQTSWKTDDKQTISRRQNCEDEQRFEDKSLTDVSDINSREKLYKIEDGEKKEKCNLYQSGWGNQAVGGDRAAVGGDVEILKECHANDARPKIATTEIKLNMKIETSAITSDTVPGLLPTTKNGNVDTPKLDTSRSAGETAEKMTGATGVVVEGEVEEKDFSAPDKNERNPSSSLCAPRPTSPPPGGDRLTLTLPPLLIHPRRLDESEKEEEMEKGEGEEGEEESDSDWTSVRAAIDRSHVIPISDTALVVESGSSQGGDHHKDRFSTTTLSTAASGQFNTHPHSPARCMSVFAFN